MSIFKKASNSPNVSIDSVDNELFIDVNNLNDELMDQPLLYRKYATLKAKASRVLGAIKNKLEQVKSQARLEFKNNGQKLTVADMDAHIALDPKVMQVQEEFLAAQEQYEDLEGLVYSLRQRHEAIKELCANIRKELVD